jgi:predicted GNAT superfamily acetyltransferase
MNKVGRDMQNAIPSSFNLDASINGAYSMAGRPGMAGSLPDDAGSVTNHFHIAELVVREEADIDKIAAALFRKQQQARRSQGVAFA